MKRIIGYYIQYIKFHLLYRKYKNFTMCPESVFHQNLKLAISVKSLSGDVVECGVWRGGLLAALSEILGERNYYAFDSFEGLPPAKEIDGKNAINYQLNKNSPSYWDNCSATEDYVKKAFRISKNDNLIVHKGWFETTLPKVDFNKSICFAHIDGDWYDSTLVALEHIWPRIVVGGIVIIDDYYVWDGCTKAVHKFLNDNSQNIRIYTASGSGCYIIKSA